jgi:tetrahydromethanopterin S-methyltransferase subunit G
MQTGESSLGSVVQVKNWHVLLTLALWLVLVVAAFTTLRDDAEESKRRIHDLEQRPVVTEQQYENGQHGLEQRLDRIERKIDNASAEIRSKP